jgi:hypothetical protein
MSALEINQTVIVTHVTQPQRQPSALGNAVAMGFVTLSLAAVAVCIYYVAHLLLAALGYTLESAGWATAGFAGWIGEYMPAVFSVLSAGFIPAVTGIVRGIAIATLWFAGVYLVVNGVQYAIAEQRHRHALAAERILAQRITIVEQANRLAQRPTTHLLPVAQQDIIDIQAKEEKIYARI